MGFVYFTSDYKAPSPTFHKKNTVLRNRKPELGHHTVLIHSVYFRK